MNSLQDFMISKVRVKMMELFFVHTEEMYYVREITRSIKEEINAVRRELDRMLTEGILKSEQRGNRLYYSLNTKYLFFAYFIVFFCQNRDSLSTIAANDN